jgi:hypothetical protein
VYVRKGKVGFAAHGQPDGGPWNKGKTGVYSEDTLRRISENNGRSNLGKVGPLNHGWLGEDAKYQAKHVWIRRHYGRADRCENLDCTYKNPKLYHWANLSGEYHRERDDYVMLCPSCHKKMDLGTAVIRLV